MNVLDVLKSLVVVEILIATPNDDFLDSLKSMMIVEVLKTKVQ